MKRYVKASRTDILITSPMFDLVVDRGVGMNNTPWTGLKVISKGAAEKHVIEVRLESRWVPADDFDGAPIQFVYNPSGTEVAHGSRMRKDTLDDTREYIQALQEALDFAENVNSYIVQHPEWLAKPSSRRVD